MSGSVACCLEYLNKEGTEQTRLFIRMVDMFFDYLNVKSTLMAKTKRKQSREPYRSSSDARFKYNNCLMKQNAHAMYIQYPSDTRYKAHANYTRLHAETNALVH